jgi:hypothetical protein
MEYDKYCPGREKIKGAKINGIRMDIDDEKER